MSDHDFKLRQQNGATSLQNDETQALFIIIIIYMVNESAHQTVYTIPFRPKAIHP